MDILEMHTNLKTSKIKNIEMQHVQRRFKNNNIILMRKQEAIDYTKASNLIQDLILGIPLVVTVFETYDGRSIVMKGSEELRYVLMYMNDEFVLNSDHTPQIYIKNFEGLPFLFQNALLQMEITFVIFRGETNFKLLERVFDNGISATEIESFFKMKFDDLPYSMFETQQ